MMVERRLEQVVCESGELSLLIRCKFDVDRRQWRASAPTCSYGRDGGIAGPVLALIDAPRLFSQ